jgi:hypothetical protein
LHYPGNVACSIWWEQIQKSVASRVAMPPLGSLGIVPADGGFLSHL